MVFLKTQRLPHIIGIARGRGQAPPSRYCLHLFHDLIPLINTHARCISPNSNPLGLPYLRSIGITFAETLKNLSEGFYHLRKVAPDFCNPSLSQKHFTTSSPVKIDDSEISWPHGAKRLGDVLAQVIHCLCGISTKNKQQTGVVYSVTSDSLSISCDSYGNSTLYEGTRFKVCFSTYKYPATQSLLMMFFYTFSQVLSHQNMRLKRRTKRKKTI